jgi:hypothetical protein
VLPQGGSVVEGQCSYCGLRKYFVNSFYGRRAATRVLQAQEAAAVLSKRLQTLHVEAESTDDDWYSLVSALAVTGAGSLASLEGLTRQLVPTVHPSEVARHLCGLGFIDLDVGAWQPDPVAWSVPTPAVLSLGKEDEKAIVGSPTPQVIEALTAAGATMLPRRPGAIAVCPMKSSLSARDLAAAASGRSTHLDVVDPQAIVSRLPTLDALIGGLKAVTVHDTPEVFDLRRQTWVSGRDPKLGNAIRFGNHPRVYGLVTGAGGNVVRTDFRLAKHLSARRSGIPILSYDPAQRVLQVPLGADLPVMYDRVAMLCSGQPPTKSGGRLVYSNVPIEIAQALWARLGPRRAA